MDGHFQFKLLIFSFFQCLPLCTALVQSVSVDYCNDDDLICKFMPPNDLNFSLNYHVDFVANQEAKNIQMELSIKLYNATLFHSKDAFVPISHIEDLCQTNIDVCPTNISILYHIAYGFKLKTISILKVFLLCMSVIATSTLPTLILRKIAKTRKLF